MQIGSLSIDENQTSSDSAVLAMEPALDSHILPFSNQHQTQNTHCGDETEMGLLLLLLLLF